MFGTYLSSRTVQIHFDVIAKAEDPETINSIPPETPSHYVSDDFYLLPFCEFELTDVDGPEHNGLYNVRFTFPPTIDCEGCIDNPIVNFSLCQYHKNRKDLKEDWGWNGINAFAYPGYEDSGVYKKICSGTSNFGAVFAWFRRNSPCNEIKCKLFVTAKDALGGVDNKTCGYHLQRKLDAEGFLKIASVLSQ